MHHSQLCLPYLEIEREENKVKLKVKQLAKKGEMGSVKVRG